MQTAPLSPSLVVAGQLLSLKGRFWVFSVRHACLSLLVPEATGYSQSRQFPVFALEPWALENTGNQSELGYKAVLLKTALERYRVVALPCDGLPGAETPCMRVCLLACLLKNLFDFKLHTCMHVSVWV